MIPSWLFCSEIESMMHVRHAARVKNLGGQVVLGGDNVSPLVEIGLTDLPKSGGEWAAAPLPPPPCCIPERKITMNNINKVFSNLCIHLLT